jgi:hypothetical protein
MAKKPKVHLQDILPGLRWRVARAGGDCRQIGEILYDRDTRSYRAVADGPDGWVGTYDNLLSAMEAFERFEATRKKRIMEG